MRLSWVLGNGKPQDGTWEFSLIVPIESIREEKQGPPDERG